MAERKMDFDRSRMSDFPRGGREWKLKLRAKLDSRGNGKRGDERGNDKEGKPEMRKYCVGKCGNYGSNVREF